MLQVSHFNIVTAGSALSLLVSQLWQGHKLWRVEKSVYNYLHNIKHFTSMSQISATSHHRRLYSKKYNLRPRLHLPKDLRDSLRRSQGCHHSTMTQSDQRSLKKSKDLTLKRCQPPVGSLGIEQPVSFAEKTSILDWMSRLYFPPVIIRPGTLRKKSSTLSAFV